MTATRHGVPLTTKERLAFESEQAEARRMDKQALAEKCKAAGMKKRTMIGPDGKTQVEVWAYSSSYHAMGFQDHQIYAAERFARDWETAYRTLKGQRFEAGVDGGRSIHGAHFAQIEAQSRLAECLAYLGQRAFQIVVGVVVNGATLRVISALGGKDPRAIKADMESAFDDLDAFYTGNRRKDRTWEAIEQFNAERAAMIERAEREVG
jgi:hypothetical protein